jgi:hypothetical protein
VTLAAVQMRDVRSPWLWRALLGACALVFAWVLWLTSYKNFFYDEWDFVTQARSWTVNVFLQAHNEHWSTIPILVWKVLFVTVGLRSHVPYEAAALIVHVTTVLLLFTLVRMRSGDLPAFGAAITVLVLGGGGLNIVWAFQIGWVGSIAFGLLAMLLLNSDLPFPTRLVISSGALLGSLMCSGVGLAFVVAVGVELLFDACRRRLLPAVIVPTALFVAWFVAYGAGLRGTPGAPCPTCAPTGFAADIHKGPIGIDYLSHLAAFVASGLEASIGAVFGAPALAAILLPILAALLAFSWYRQRTIHSWQLGMVVGVVAWFTLVGLGRAQRGPGGATDSHYLYIGAVFLLPLIADAAKELPWRWLWKPTIAIAFAVAVSSNVVQLRDLALGQTDTMRIENAELQTVDAFRGAPDMELDRGLDDVIMPQLRAGSYLEATSQLGSPVPHATVDTLKQLPTQVVDREMVNLFGKALTVTPDPSRSTQGVPCRRINSPAGSTIDLQVTAGESIVLVSSGDGDAYFFLGFLNPPTSQPVLQVFIPSSTPESVHMPNTGKPTVWLLRIQTNAVGLLQICGEGIQQGQTANIAYKAAAVDGQLGSGWSAVSDSAATGGRAARLAAGTSILSYTNDLFTTWFIPNPGLYDVWYRVRVAHAAGARPDLTLGVWDGTASTWVVSRAYASNQLGSVYSWVKVAAGIFPVDQHYVQFQASFIGLSGPATLSTDWFLDEAAIVPIGSPPPA